jgi:predicted HTH domain antitoxin
VKIADASELRETPAIKITVQIPAEVAALFGDSPRKMARQLLEQAAVEGYRSNMLSRGNVSKMLGLDWSETEEFLAQHHCERHYDLQDLEEDRHTLDELFGPA